MDILASVSVSTFLVYQSALDKIAGGFAVSDTAANISSGLNLLGDGNIQSITISDNAVVGGSVGLLTSDAAALGKLVNANGTPYQLAIIDSAANLLAGLATLEANVANIAWIAATDGPLIASTSTFVADQAALDKITGGFAISDIAASISSGLNLLGDTNIQSITISDSAAVGASVGQLTSDAAALGKLVNANGTPYQLAITDSAANVLVGLATLETNVANIASITATVGPLVVSASTFAADQAALDKFAGGFDVSDTAAHVAANLSRLNADSHADAIIVTSGSATLSGGAVINAPNFAETGSGTTLIVSEALGYAGGFSQGASSSTAITAANSLSLTGTVGLGGTTSGAGTLVLAGGSATISSGAKLSVADLSISGSGTSVTLGENLTYAGAFSEAAGDTFVLSGGNLLLNGANDVFSGGTVDGSNFLYTEGTTAVSGLTIGGTVEWENTSAVNQSGGNVTLGDNIPTDEAILYNTPKATYDILDNSGIGLGVSTASYVKNAGLFEKTGGTGTSVIAPAFSETGAGTVTVASGTLVFSGLSNSFAGAITGSGTLQLAGGSNSINSGATLSVAGLSISGSGTSVTLGENLTYAGAFSEAAGDTFVLSGGNLLLNGANDAFSGGTVDGSNFLYTEGTTAVSGLTIGGAVEWENTSAVNQSGGNVTLGDNIPTDEAILYNTPKATYDILDGSGIGLGASTASYVKNGGLLEKTGGIATSVIAPAVTNNGTIEVAAATLDLEGAVTGTGTDDISGASTLEFDSTVATGQTVSFTGSAGALDLGDPQGFSGKISGFDTVGANDTLEVAGPWVFSGFTENAGGTQGALAFANGASRISLTLLGDYVAANFTHQTLATGGTTITYT